MATELATAYLSLIPELKGAGKSIASQLGGVDVAPTGRKLGKSLSDGISSGIDSSGIKQLENAVAKASQKVGRAMASEKDATNQLKIAQQRLIEVRSKYADGSSQVMAAEAKVESAQRKATSASERTKSAQVELKRAQEQLSSANKKVSSSSDDASRGIASMGKAAGSVKGALGALAKVAGPILAAVGFSQLVGEAAAATDATQKFKSTLDFAGLGAPEIEALSKSTRKYADDTVYALSDIQNITAQLAANSVPNYDKLAEAAGNLNAVAGGNAETFESVGMVLTQTAGAGKLTTENWNQLADAIPGASGKLQEAMLKNGAYTGNFRKAMEQGQISAEEFNQAIMQLGFEDAAVKAAKSTETFEGAIGNMQAAFVGGISDALAKLQPLVTGAINALTPAVEGAFKGISDAIGGVVQWVQDFMAQLEQNGAVQLFADICDKLWQALQNVGTFASTAANEIFGFGEDGDSAKLAADALKDSLQFVKDNFDLLAGAVGGVVGGLIAFKGALAISALVQALSGALTALRNGTLLAAAAQAVLNFVMSLNPFVIVVTAIGILIGAFMALWTTNEGFRNFVTQCWETIKVKAEEVFGKLCEFFTVTVPNAIQDMQNWFQQLPGKIAVWLENAKTKVGEFANGVKTKAIEAGKNFLNGIKTGFENAVRFVASIPQKILSAIGNVGNLLVNAGKSIIDGFLQGLKSAFGKVQDFVGGIGDWIVSHKGPPSYDAVMLTKNGELIMRGLLDGMISGWGDVEDFIGSRNASISASYAVSPTYSPRDFTPSASGDGSAVIEWLERNLGDIISDRTPVMGSRDFARMSRRAVGYGI